MARPTIVLIGLRGSGKSEVGRVLADRLGERFTDLDTLTAEAMGEVTPASAIRLHGIDAFRVAEAGALRAALEREGVLSLGGGTPTAPGAAEMLRDSGVLVVYLRAQPATLRVRLEATDVMTRPSLTGAGTLAEIESVFAQRDGLYSELGRVLDCDGLSIEGVARELEGWVRALS